MNTLDHSKIKIVADHPVSTVKDLKRVLSSMKDSDKILVTSHQNSDPDDMGPDMFDCVFPSFKILTTKNKVIIRGEEP